MQILLETTDKDFNSDTIADITDDDDTDTYLKLSQKILYDETAKHLNITIKLKDDTDTVST